MNPVPYTLADYLPHILPQAYATGIIAGAICAFAFWCIRQHRTAVATLASASLLLLVGVFVTQSYRAEMAKARYADTLDADMRDTIARGDEMNALADRVDAITPPSNRVARTAHAGTGSASL